jgi:hypothetical protein
MDEVKQPASLDSGLEAFKLGFQSVVAERGLSEVRVFPGLFTESLL